jgi:NTP pyrophosphatase (non-canonical NTP hydrolase)
MTDIVLRPSLQRFAELMEKTLRENDHKGGWENMSTSSIMRRIDEELGELKDARIIMEHAAFTRSTTFAARCRQVAKEAADVANFAMMLADNVTKEK